jgi:flagellar biosynthesis/type III secretory pathway protein FliH
MLPFLKKKQEGSASMPSDSIVREPDNEQDYDSMHAVAEDLLKAIEAKDVAAIAEAFRAGFELADSESHEEGEHV